MQIIWVRIKWKKKLCWQSGKEITTSVKRPEWQPKTGVRPKEWASTYTVITDGGFAWLSEKGLRCSRTPVKKIPLLYRFRHPSKTSEKRKSRSPSSEVIRLRLGSRMMELPLSIPRNISKLLWRCLRMLNDLRDIPHVYIACGYVDLWKGIDLLVRIVRLEFKSNHFGEWNLFLLCGRRTDRIKVL